MLKVSTFWYTKNKSIISLILLPLTVIYALISSLRRYCYQSGIFKTCRLPAPVIIVGNICVGGTGKSPLVGWLANELSEQGYRPGIVSRGYGGKRRHDILWVADDSAVAESGDEALMLARQTHCPVVVGVDRVAAARELLAKSDCNVIISDDGLQHYRLDRDIEMVVVDGERQFGNGLLLPSGPLREPISRLKKIDFVVVNGVQGASPYAMCLKPTKLVSLSTGQSCSLLEVRQKRIHAVAGIGNPARFFESLRMSGFDVIEHAFPDHHSYVASDLAFGDQLAIVMTEKDAVKCMHFANERCWYLAIQVSVSGGFIGDVLQKLRNLEVENEDEAGAISDTGDYSCDGEYRHRGTQ